jgi:homoserine dehydrogenase
VTTALRIAVAGLGTVGVGTLELLEAHGELIAQRGGRPFLVSAVSARDRRKDRGVNLTGVRWFEDAVAMAADPQIDVVLELIGGSEAVAKEVVETAIANGKHVITANKALMAHHGTALALKAEAAGVVLSYEAAVAGGIPIIKAIREGLAGNGISRVYGVLNGTCNYILSTMRETGREFAEVLAEAQRLGYAEADPAFDVDGVDAAHKLAILTGLAFGCEVNFDGVHVEGIRDISALDIVYAEELGLRIKLLGLTRLIDGGVEQRVHPSMVRADAPIANVEGVFNAVVAEGDFVDTILAERGCRSDRSGPGRPARHFRGTGQGPEEDSLLAHGAPRRVLLSAPHGAGQAGRAGRGGRRPARSGDFGRDRAAAWPRAWRGGVRGHHHPPDQGIAYDQGARAGRQVRVPDGTAPHDPNRIVVKRGLEFQG